MEADAPRAPEIWLPNLAQSPVCRPPGVAPEHARHYKTWHYRALGLPGKDILQNCHTYICGVGGLDDLCKSAAGIGLDDDDNEGEAKNTEEPGEFDDMPWNVAAATAELVAASSVAKRRLSEAIEISTTASQPLPVLGSGRAARLARQRRAEAQRQLAAAASISEEKRLEREAEEREGLAMAWEDLRTAKLMHQRKIEDAKEEQVRKEMTQQVLKLQASRRALQARTKMKRLREQREMLLKSEISRLWGELRQPREVRIVSRMMQHVADMPARGQNQSDEADGSEATATATNLEVESDAASVLSSRFAVAGLPEVQEEDSDGNNDVLDEDNDKAETEKYMQELTKRQSIVDPNRALSPSTPDVLRSPSPKEQEQESKGQACGDEDGVVKSLSTAKAREPGNSDIPRGSDVLSGLLAVPQPGVVELKSRSPSPPKSVDATSEKSQPRRPKHSSLVGKRALQKRACRAQEKLDVMDESLVRMRSALLVRVEDFNDPHYEEKPNILVNGVVRKQYIEECKKMGVKPNSKVLDNIEPTNDDNNLHHYDFTDAHVGDRGIICLLLSLSHDPYCCGLSLQSCGLRGASAVYVACFLELHPRLSYFNLSNNSFSFDAGELILEALTRRSRGQSFDTVYKGLLSRTKTEVKLRELCVNLAGTPLAWDHGGMTVGPPCGTLWAGNSERYGNTAPSGYRKLQELLEGTRHVVSVGSPKRAGPRPRERRPSASSSISAPPTGTPLRAS
eukprot:TRINITY_DN27476_c0_g1_i2.p1 TRINITY_DN27476_c0_g1~~TRINITY_DN27476_c0_g1_i2.p1  ORF type:complete len:756 (+),score=121.07 TRINITY_DN27476_c0_g1_i2:58-2268(+)